MKYILSVISFLIISSCNSEANVYDLLHNHVLFNSDISPQNLSINNIKIGDSVSTFDLEKLKVLVVNYTTEKEKAYKQKNFSLTESNKLIVYYQNGYNYILKDGRVQSFLLNGNSIEKYNKVTIDNLEQNFGFFDKKNVNSNFDDGDLLSTNFLFYKKNLKVNFNSFDSIVSIEIGTLPRKDLLYISEEEKLKIANLNLNDLDLKELPLELKGFKNLKSLKLNGNKITILPEWISYFKKLETLELEQNKINFLPPQIGELTKLKDLSLIDNNLDSLPESICNLKSLQTLFIQKNNLTSLPPKIGDLSNLELLLASNNKLFNIPKSIGSMDKLYSLFLDKNNLKDLPSSIKNCKVLHKLRLANNFISEENKVKIDSLTNCNPWFDFSELKSISYKNLKDTVITINNTYHYVN